MSAIIKVSGLKKSFVRSLFSERQIVLNGIDFKINPGVITGFLGANGAGKTTTMKCLLGLIFADEGQFEYFGANKLNSSVKKRIGFLPERPYFYSYLTGQEFLQFYGKLSGGLSNPALKDRISSLLKRVDLYYAKDKALREYSKGMLQKIGFAQAIIHEPDLVVLDEPMSGLDPDGRFYLSELIKETAKDGHSVFLSSHLLHDTEQLCEDLVILKKGLVFFEGKTQALLSQINAKYKIQYLSQNTQEVCRVDNIEEVQEKLSELRHKNCLIEKVEQDRMTLEEYFVKDVLRE